MMYKISRSIVAIDDTFFRFTINSQTRGKLKVLKLSVQATLGHSHFHVDAGAPARIQARVGKDF